MKIKIKVSEKGGAGSGNWGHAGRPGMVGGSAGRTGIGAGMSILTGRTARQRQEEARKPTPSYSFSDMSAQGEGAVDGNRVLNAGLSEISGAASDETWDEADRSVRGLVKVGVTEDLASRTGLPIDQVNDYVGQWAFTSNDNDMRSLSLQQAAAEEFGVELSAWQEKNLGRMRQERSDIPPSISVGPETHPSLFSLMPREEERALFRAQYESTQEYLKGLGYASDDTITLYRGVMVEALPDKGVAAYTGNAVESWTVDEYTALEFADGTAISPESTRITGGIVLSANVPVSNIVSTARTGPGCLTEGEILTLGTLPGSQVNVISASSLEEMWG